MSCELGMMNTLLLQVDCMETKSDSKQMLLGGLLKGGQEERKETFISRAEEKTTRHTREKQIDRKSHCDTKQSQITLLCPSWHIIVWPSRRLFTQTPHVL